MSAQKPKFHSFVMANGAVAENFHLEQLSAVPGVIDRTGRLFSLATGEVYFTTNVGGVAVARQIGSAEALAAAVSDLQGQINSLSTGSGAALTQEIADRQAGDTALAADIAAEASTRAAADSSIRTDFAAADAAEAAARTTADQAVADQAAQALATETAARQAGDDAANDRMDNIQAELDTTQAGVGLANDGTFVAPTESSYLGSATSVVDALSKLDTAVANAGAGATSGLAALQSALNNEIQAREDAITNLETQLQAWVQTQINLDNNTDAALVAAEAAERTSADAALKAEIDATQAAIGLNPDGSFQEIDGSNYMDAATTVYGAAAALDTNLKRVDDAVVAETTRATAREDALQAQIDTFNQGQTADLNALQSEVNTVESSVGLETDGTYVAPVSSNYLGGTTTVKGGLAALDLQIKSNADAIATNAANIGDVAADLAQEVTDRTAAVSAEATARAAGDATNAAAIAQEVTDRTAAVATVTAAVNAEVTRATTAEAALDTRVSDLEASAGAGAEALKADLNDGRKRFVSATAATTHTFTHNLGHDDFQLTVWVKEDTVGAKWRTDVFAQELAVDGNSITFYLDEPLLLRASLTDNSALA